MKREGSEGKRVQEKRKHKERERKRDNRKEVKERRRRNKGETRDKGTKGHGIGRSKLQGTMYFRSIQAVYIYVPIIPVLSMYITYETWRRDFARFIPRKRDIVGTGLVESICRRQRIRKKERGTEWCLRNPTVDQPFYRTVPQINHSIERYQPLPIVQNGTYVVSVNHSIEWSFYTLVNTNVHHSAEWMTILQNGNSVILFYRMVAFYTLE